MFVCAKPSKRVAQGGRHLSFKGSLLSKEANIDTPVVQSPMRDGAGNFLSSAGSSVCEKAQKGSNHDVTKVLAFEPFSFLLDLCPFL
jgi:hypothetical protein